MRDIMREVYVDGGWADPQRSPGYVASLLDARGRIPVADVLLVEFEEQPVATVTATSQPPLANVAQPGELEVRMLAVRETARRQGVAQALMAACEDLARQRGLRRVVLSTDAAMTAAQGLYDRLGYRRTPDRDWPIDGEVLLTYAKDL